MAATVDYVGVEGVYLSVGTDDGAQAGDTITVYRSEGDQEPLGRVVLTAASRRRSVAAIVEPAFAITAGTLIYMDVRTAFPSDEAPAPQPAGAAPPSGGQAAAASRALRAAGGPRVTGRISLDVDARETRTSWQGDLFGTTTRRFATPTSSLSLTIADLPGGFRLETNLRGSYRYRDFSSFQPTTSVRIYSLAAVKAFEAVPLEMRLGRFYNPYESYSAYWDGAMMRLGGRSGPGIGAAVGYEPDRSDEGFSRDVLKLSGFADYAARGRTWSYDTDVSLHSVRPTDAEGVDRTFVGWSQYLSVGRASLSQRIRADRDADAGSWSLSQIRVRGGVSVAGPLRLTAGYGRIRLGALRGLPGIPSPVREELTGGLGVVGPNGAFSVDVGSTRWDDAARGLAVTASASGRVGGALLSASGRRWARAGVTSLSAAPGVSFGVGWLETRLGYQFYQTKGTTTLRSHAGDLSFTTRLGERLSLTLRGQQQWGTNFGGTRLNFRVWRSF